jgi:hypothetical protein
MHDPKSFELAEYFLPSDAAPSVKSGLAQHIQDAIEDFLSVYDTDDEIPRSTVAQP